MDQLNEDSNEKSNKHKREFTDAYYFCGQLLKENDFCFDDENEEEKISKRSALYGQKMFDYILRIKEEMSKTSGNDVKSEKTKIIPPQNSDKEKPDQPNPSSEQKEIKKKKPTRKNSSNSEVSVESKKPKLDTSSSSESAKINKKTFIPYEEKMRVVKMARKHPKWSLTRLKEETDCESLKSFDQLNRWTDQVEKGGSRREIKERINEWVYAKCIECHELNEIIYNDLLQLWANKAKEVCFPHSHQKIKFGASITWLNEFKKLFNISGPGFDLELNDENICKKKQFDEPKQDVIVENGVVKPRDCLSERNQTLSGDINQKIKMEEEEESRDIDEAEKVNQWIYQQCVEFREKKMKFSDEMIKKWAIEATNIYLSQISQEFSQCDPSNKWLCKFKKTHNITGPPSDLQLNDFAIDLTKENRVEQHIDEEIPEINITIKSVTSLASEEFKSNIPKQNMGFTIKSEPV